MVERRCAKPPEGVVRRLTLLETVIQGLRAHVNKMRLEIFRLLEFCMAWSMVFVEQKSPGFCHINKMNE